MLYKKMLESDHKAKERMATSRAFAYANAILVVTALMCLYFNDVALASIVLAADLFTFVAYLVMMALI